jgi:hypothetical protein
LDWSLITTAEENAHLPANSITLYIHRITETHNRKNPDNKKKNVDLWTGFVTDHYERIESAVKVGNKGKQASLLLITVVPDLFWLRYKTLFVFLQNKFGQCANIYSRG